MCLQQRRRTVERDNVNSWRVKFAPLLVEYQLKKSADLGTTEVVMGIGTGAVKRTFASRNAKILTRLSAILAIGILAGVSRALSSSLRRGGGGASVPGLFESVIPGQRPPGFNFSCGLRTTEVVTCWEIIPLARESPTARYLHTAERRRHQRLRSPDRRECGLLGNNASGESRPPTGAFTQVSVGGSHASAVRTDERRGLLGIELLRTSIGAQGHLQVSECRRGTALVA